MRGWPPHSAGESQDRTAGFACSISSLDVLSAKRWLVTSQLEAAFRCDGNLHAACTYECMQAIPPASLRQCCYMHLSHSNNIGAAGVLACCLQRGDLIGNLITSAAEVPGLVFSLFMIHFCSRKLAFAVPMGLIPVALIPLMAGEPLTE